MEKDIVTYRQAMDDFRKARTKSAMQRFWAGIKGKSLDLLPYDEISSKLNAVSQTDRGLQVVRLQDIIGSVGRTDDFDRNFLPLRDSDLHRWASVKTLMTSPLAPGLPPVHLYKIGDVYFVLDGNHRVSISKQMGLEDIEAYVTELKTRVPISSSVSPEELILKASYAQYLEESKLDLILPGVDFMLTQVEEYPLLKEHIAVHQYYMGLELGRDVPYEEAVAHWYDNVYLPVISIIESSGLRDTFPTLTVTDLYLWVLDQQSRLQEDMGIPIRTENALDFAAQMSGANPKPGSNRAEQIIEDVVQSQEGPAYEEEFASLLQADCLIRDVLVALSDADPGLEALKQAILVNRCPDGNIRGLHIFPTDEAANTEKTNELQAKFDARLAEAGAQGKLLTIAGDVTRLLTAHSLLSDLLVLKLTYPPSGGFLDRTGSGLVEILRKAHRPVMVVPDIAQEMTSLMLLYDGSPKGKEALYLASYFTARYQNKLTVLTLEDSTGVKAEAIAFAVEYLQKLKLAYTYIVETGNDLTSAVLSRLEENQISTVVMGGYGGTSFLGRVFGTQVDQLLGRVRVPVLICQ